MSILVIGQHWREARSEFAFVLRSVAAAGSRVGPVSVWAPGPYGTSTPDGLFDVKGFGDAENFELPVHSDTDATVFVDELSDELVDRLAANARAPGFYLSGPAAMAGTPWRQLDIVVHPQDQRSQFRVRPYVPINPLAEQSRHNGFGFTGYLLVLAGSADPTPSAATWLTAAFHDADVIVITDSSASAWRGRVLRGQVTVDTQMDLWRLMAHASVCIDVEPGPLIARECVEALRFGTPIVVPEHSGPAATHALAGGGFTFADAGELIDAVTMLREGSERSAVAYRGRQYADATYGNPASLVDDVRALLADG